MPEIVPVRFDLNLANPLHKNVYDILMGIDPRNRSAWVFMAILLYDRNIAPGALGELASVMGSQVQGIEDKVDSLMELVKQLKYVGISAALPIAPSGDGGVAQFNDGANGAFKLE